MSELSLQQVDYEYDAAGVAIMSGAPQTVRGVHEYAEPELDDINRRLEEANDTYNVFRLGNGQWCEMFAMNTDKADAANVLKNSTSFSSALKNPGNVAEMALTAALNPNAQYVYVASFGNNPTGHLSRPGMWYVSHTGRYTYGYGTEKAPYLHMQDVAYMADVATTMFGAPTHLTADAEGSRLSLGLAAALPQDSVKGMYLNAPDGISHTASYIGARLKEDFESRYERRHRTGEKVGDLTPTGIKNTKKHLQESIYHGLGRMAHLAPLPVFLFPRDVADKVRTTLAFRTHDDLDHLQDHAVYHDTSAALRRQDATITMHFTKESAMHDIDDCIRFGELVMAHIPTELRTPERRVRLLIGEGTFDHQTDNPHGRARAERLAMPEISHPLLRVAGGLTTSQVFELPSIKTA